jgi:hypothetical protein
MKMVSHSLSSGTECTKTEAGAKVRGGGRRRVKDGGIPYGVYISAYAKSDWVCTSIFLKQNLTSLKQKQYILSSSDRDLVHMTTSDPVF